MVHIVQVFQNTLHVLKATADYCYLYHLLACFVENILIISSSLTFPFTSGFSLSSTSDCSMNGLHFNPDSNQEENTILLSKNKYVFCVLVFAYLKLCLVTHVIQECIGHFTVTVVTLQFNLSLMEDKETALEMKKKLDGRLPTMDVPICIEISLKTAEVSNIIMSNCAVQMLYMQ